MAHQAFWIVAELLGKQQITLLGKSFFVNHLSSISVQGKNQYPIKGHHHTIAMTNGILRKRFRQLQQNTKLIQLPHLMLLELPQGNQQEHNILIGTLQYN